VVAFGGEGEEAGVVEVVAGDARHGQVDPVTNRMSSAETSQRFAASTSFEVSVTSSAPREDAGRARASERR
jgi:hypothetical protein